MESPALKAVPSPSEVRGRVTLGALSIPGTCLLRSSVSDPCLPSDMLVVECLIDNCKATALLDTGASHSFISGAWSRDNGVHVLESEQPLSVKMADGVSCAVSSRQAKGARLSLADRTETHDFHILDGLSYDVILGMPWFHAWKTEY